MGEIEGTSADAANGECPPQVAEYADQAVVAVNNATGIALDYESETLSILDHYVQSVPTDQLETLALICATAGSYFGEVVRRRLGGAWYAVGEPSEWRFVLPGGLWICPAAMVAASVLRDDSAGLGDELNPPAAMAADLQAALERMSDVSAAEYYSLCGRLDTLEHVQSVLLATAADRLSRAN